MRVVVTLAFASALLHAAFAQASEALSTTDPSNAAFRLCVKDKPLLPYTTPEGGGTLPPLVRQAAKAQNLTVHIVALPWLRCLRGLATGEVDGVIGMYSPERMAFADYPQRAGRVDQNRAVGTMSFSLVWRADRPPAWDGRRLQLPPGQTVGVPHGFSPAFVQPLGDSAVPIDSGAYSAQQLLDKLMRDRVAAVVVPQPGDVERSGSSGVKLVDQPYAQFDAYLMVAKSYRAAHPRLVEALWDGFEASARRTSMISTASPRLLSPAAAAHAHCAYAS